jgi:hypothetical protein
MEGLRPLLSGLIGAVVAGLVMAWVSRGATHHLPGHVRYGRRMRATSLVMLAIGALIAYAALHAAASQRVIAFFVAAPLLAGSVWFVLETFFVKAMLTATHITHTSPWRGTRTIPWSAITGYEFSSANSCHILATRGYGKVRLSTYMSGVDQVAEHLCRQPPNDT